VSFCPQTTAGIHIVVRTAASTLAAAAVTGRERLISALDEPQVLFSCGC